jgi:hypothetical protein
VRSTPCDDRAFRRLLAPGSIRPPRNESWRISMIRTTIGKVLTVKVAVIAAIVVGMGGIALAATGGPSKSDGSASGNATKTHQPAPSGSSTPKPSHGGPSSMPSAGDFATMCHDIVSRILQQQQQRPNPLDDPSFRQMFGQDSELLDRLRKTIVGTGDFGDLSELCDRITAAPTSARPSGGGSSAAGDTAALCRKALEDVRARQADLLKSLEEDLGQANKAWVDAMKKAFQDATSDARFDEICNHAGS